MKKAETKYFILDTVEKPGMKDKLRIFKCLVHSLWYQFIGAFVRTHSVEKKYKVAVCTIFKDEAIYLREWIEFNRVVGVEHFYMYNNNSSDNFSEVLMPYVEKGIVTLTDWPQNQAQMQCYQDCVEKYKDEAQWIGFIDADEFIVPQTYESIYSFLKQFEKKRGAVKIHWKMFSSGGMLSRDTDGLVTEDFVVCWPKYSTLGKCFYNTNFDIDFGSVRNKALHHTCWTRINGPEFPPVNALDRFCFGRGLRISSHHHPIQINHYYSKSYEEYKQKIIKGDVFHKVNPHDDAYFFLREQEGSAVDYSAYRYMLKTKLSLQNKN